MPGKPRSSEPTDELSEEIDCPLKKTVGLPTFCLKREGGLGIG